VLLATALDGAKTYDELLVTAMEPRPTMSCWLLHWSQDLRKAVGDCTGAKTYDELLATALEPRPTMSCWPLHWSQDLR
jgi:hypothetical protein